MYAIDIVTRTLNKLLRKYQVILSMLPFSLKVNASSPVIVDNRIYLGSCYGRVVCLDKNTLREIWQYQIAQQPPNRDLIFCDVIASTGMVYFGDNNGKFYALVEKELSAK